MADWSRIVNSTTRDYIKQEEVNVMRNRKLTALLESRGRVSFNHSGDDMDWKVRYRRAPMSGYADADVLNFPRYNRRKTATLPYRGYQVVDSMTKGERLKNRGRSQIINLYAGLTEELMDDIRDQFGDEFYIDGNASGNSKRMHGIESFMSNSGASSNGFIGDPNDSYAGLDCTPGGLGGSWTGNWPTGEGDAHYDFWSPLILDYTDTSWTASTKTWPNTCVEVIRYGIVKSHRNKGMRGLLDLILLENELYRQFLDHADAKERINITRGKVAGGKQDIGFGDEINFDGVLVSFEFGIPSNLGYGFNVDEMKLCSMQDRLFVVEGPDYDIASKSWRFGIDFYGNLRFNPRCFVKLLSIT